MVINYVERFSEETGSLKERIRLFKSLRLFGVARFVDSSQELICPVRPQYSKVDREGLKVCLCACKAAALQAAAAQRVFSMFWQAQADHGQMLQEYQETELMLRFNNKHRDLLDVIE
eukprot:TRINITY_DN3316_c0_g1_i1.p1 TRINITY_DN3316_c0_g1~~TRINITY_DN3316_c0_g1_i1.p1  ORF type:complete len:117 (+),score=28.28 TRINITY_DN3316_c0_g1_i1:472-822(+)